MVLLGTGVALSGCQSPSQGGVAFWKSDSSASLPSATPDVGRQKYEGLAKEFGSPARSGTAPLGGQPPASNDNFLTASWKKTTGAVAGAFTSQPTGDNLDPLRLDQPTRKVGPEVHVGAAQLMENQGKFAEAEAHYQKALAAAPNDVNALVGLARMHDRQGHPQKAIEIYQRAYKANPQSGLVLNDLGLCYARQRQFDPALKALTRATELSPDNPKYRNNLATVLVETGRINEAVQAMSVGSSAAVAHYNVGYLLYQKGQAPEATRHFQQALAIDPALAPARQMLAQLGGNFGAQPLAQQPAAQPRYQTAHAPNSAAQARAAAPTSPGYHLSDDAPAAELSPRGTNWGDIGAQPLPSVE
jgi:tetratricopeptide (TPR) repeat protein